MKITIIAPVFPFRGGIAQSTEILYHKLKTRGHDVQIINFQRQYPNVFFPGKSQFVADAEAVSDVESERVVDSINPFSWYKAFLRISRFQPQLLIFRYWMPFFAPLIGSVGWLVKRKLACRIIMICDNIIPHERRFGDLALTRFALKNIDCFIPLSEFVKTDLLKLSPRADYRVVPHPLYESFGQPFAKDDARRLIGLKATRVILFFGYVRAYKGLDIVIRALPAILKQQPVTLLIVGEFYEAEEKYSKMIKNLGVEKNVKIHAEFVKDADVKQYFSAADIVVLPYKSATQSGIVQLAYHLDKPCIVTDVGGLSEVVIDGKTGYVVRPDDPIAVAEAVNKFYRENKESEFTNNVKEAKKTYSWERMVDVIEMFARQKEGER